eukprot:5226134-Heterocapsa_arctica.AAC.1
MHEEARTIRALPARRAPVSLPEEAPVRRSVTFAAAPAPVAGRVPEHRLATPKASTALACAKVMTGVPMAW